ncbi:GrpB family protein [Paenibacillus sp.]|uniref:GrpB family protein n=1 Tax=Paenibacillus sp. TaxID=58172 RepID=UPI002D349D8C|nr:GrpB family protein [Paenibacillus sp.]HZG86732.1 GrpB family protein [Paenibacillus sp.]
MSEEIIICEYSDEWPRSFRDIGSRLRASLGEAALRIDHIGSTAVSGLAAKPVVDIQITVRRLEPIEAYKAAVEAAGFVHRPENPDLTKRYFRESPGDRRTHIHVRADGSWSQQCALLFRDYLRVHPEACVEYAAAKRELAAAFRGDRSAYVEAKEPVVWAILRKASAWSQRVGWTPGETDH